MMVVPPDLPQVEGGAAAKVDGRVLLAHAPMVVVRKALVRSAVIAYGVEIKLQEDQVLVLLGGWSPKPMVLVTRPGMRQTVARTELVDRTGLTVIAGEDASLGPFFRRQRVVDRGYLTRHLFPAELIGNGLHQQRLHMRLHFRRPDTDGIL